MKTRVLPFNEYSHICISILFLLFSCAVFSQDIVIDYNAKEVNACTKYRNDPVKLVAELTKGKSTDKEKFDAIFAWVALNIKYDYSKYYSETGNPSPDLASVLKKKKGICIDYAALMDKLCGLAGIKSYTVPGYAKTELFDVGDPLFADNHVWNAVKLEDEWYVYDVTWASGKRVITLSRSGRFIDRILSRWPVKTKKKTIKNKFLKEAEKYCPPESFEKIPKKFVFTSERNRFPFILKLISGFSAPFVFKYERSLDTSFYLCQPEVLFVTHYPDQPVWTLLEDRSINYFSKDSAYYYRSRRDYLEQTRRGVICPQCDSIAAYDIVTSTKDLLKNSFKANPNNRFLTFECEYSLGSMKFQDAVFAVDSLKKLKDIDTALVFFYEAKKSLQMARRHTDTEYRFQRRKNKKKSVSQFQENKKHRLFFNGLNARAGKQRFKIRNTKRNMRVPKNKLRYRRKFLIDMKTDYELLKPDLDSKNADKIRSKITKLQTEREELNETISKQKAELSEAFPTVIDSIKKKLQEYHLFISPFQQKVSLRRQFYDDYKKEIIDKKKYIEKIKPEFKRDLDSGVFNLVQEIDAKITVMRALIDKRNELSKKIEAESVKLVRGNAEPASNLEVLKSELINENTDDLCWYVAHSYFYVLEAYGFGYLADMLKSPDYLFRQEYYAERSRYWYVDKVLDKKRRTEKNIIRSNSRLNNSHIRTLKKWRKKLIKYNRDAARK